MRVAPIQSVAGLSRIERLTSQVRENSSWLTAVGSQLESQLFLGLTLKLEPHHGFPCFSDLELQPGTTSSALLSLQLADSPSQNYVNIHNHVSQFLLINTQRHTQTQTYTQIGSVSICKIYGDTISYF